MKTTIDITGALFEAVRRVADREGTTFRALVEEGLRRVTDSRKASPAFRLRKRTFKGKGLARDLVGQGWEAVRARAYDRHGG